MNISKLLSLLFVIVIASSCGILQLEKDKDSEPLTMEVVQKKFPGYTLTEYQAGEGLYKVNCGKCHSLYEAGSLTESQWLSTIPRMAVKVNKKVGRELISVDGEQAIFRYLYSQGMLINDQS